MKKSSLHIGIVGCSAEGAALCFKTICKESTKVMGTHSHPEISMHTHSLADYVSCLNANDFIGVGNLMLSSAEKLKKIGADFLICPDNTIHQAFDHVSQLSPLPWLNIIDVVVESARKLGFNRLGILGTKWLVESELYPSKIENAGLSWRRPTSIQINEIGRIIMDELVYGVCNHDSILYFQSVIKQMKREECDAVVLGCTEIPLLINNSNSLLPTLDSNRLLAEAAIIKAANINQL